MHQHDADYKQVLALGVIKQPILVFDGAVPSAQEAR